MGCSGSTENTSKKFKKGKKGKRGGRDNSQAGDAASLFSSLNSSVKTGATNKQPKRKGKGSRRAGAAAGNGTELTIDEPHPLGALPGAVEHNPSSGNASSSGKATHKGKDSNDSVPLSSKNPLLAISRATTQQDEGHFSDSKGNTNNNNTIRTTSSGQGAGRTAENAMGTVEGEKRQHILAVALDRTAGHQESQDGRTHENISVGSSHRSSSTAAAYSATAFSNPGATINLSTTDAEGTTNASTMGAGTSIRPSMSSETAGHHKSTSGSNHQQHTNGGGGVGGGGGQGLLDTLLSNPPSLADPSDSHGQVARASNFMESVSSTLPTSLQPGQKIPAPQAPPVPTESLLQPDANMHLADEARRPSESSSYFDEHRKQSTISQVERRRQRLDVPNQIPRGRRMHTKTKVHVRSWIDDAWGWSSAPHAMGALFRRGSLNGGVSAGPSESAGTLKDRLTSGTAGADNQSSMKQPSAYLVDPIAFTAELKAKQQEQDLVSQREEPAVADSSFHSNATSKSAPLVVGYYNPGKLVLPLLDPEDVQEQIALEQTMEEHNRGGVNGSTSDFGGGQSANTELSATPSYHNNASSPPGQATTTTTTTTTTMAASRGNQRAKLKAAATGSPY